MWWQLSHRENVMRAVETGQYDQLEHYNTVSRMAVGLGPETGQPEPERDLRQHGVVMYDPAHPLVGRQYTVPIHQASAVDDWKLVG